MFTKKEDSELAEKKSQICESGNMFIFLSYKLLESHHSTCRYRAGIHKHCRRCGDVIMQIMMASTEMLMFSPSAFRASKSTR